ncbi:TPA: hypothetical protein VH368_001099 [Streptococcus pyogenes]|nr:hypothetical protein [Streptococcus pyogenes]
MTTDELLQNLRDDLNKIISLDRKEQRQRIKAAELTTDEQRTRIELLKVKLDAEKGAKPDTSLMKALLDAVEGGD